MILCFVDGEDGQIIENNDNKDGADTIKITAFPVLVSLRSCIVTACLYSTDNHAFVARRH